MIVLALLCPLRPSANPGGAYYTRCLPGFRPSLCVRDPLPSLPLLTVRSYPPLACGPCPGICWLPPMDSRYNMLVVRLVPPPPHVDGPGHVCLFWLGGGGAFTLGGGVCWSSGASASCRTPLLAACFPDVLGISSYLTSKMSSTTLAALAERCGIHL